MIRSPVKQMTSPHTTDESTDQISLPAEEVDDLAEQNGQAKSGSTRKARQRSVYLFPAYGFNTALDIARRVEENGGGILTEETLAINLGLSAKSSGFRLKSLAARQFQLINKQGDTLTTTPVAKAIFKPTSNEDAQRGYREAFLSIPLFQAVCDRYRGQPLPDSQTFRNVLEREFHVEHSRVQQAERMLVDSARDAHMLRHTGDGTYLVVSETGSASVEDTTLYGTPAFDPVISRNGSGRRRLPADASQQPPDDTLTFTVKEIVELPEEDFPAVWNALGILLRARRSQAQEPAVDFDLAEEYDT